VRAAIKKGDVMTNVPTMTRRDTLAFSAAALLYQGQQGHNPPSNNLCFAGAGARDNLEVTLDVVDCSLLGLSKFHASRASFIVWTTSLIPPLLRV
jgi:hypothetical protein